MLYDIFADLSWRGLINQTTDDANLPRLLRERPWTVYAGFDPTADSLHVGHLMALMVLRRFQRAGHKPIAVIGGATGMIGDPSGKNEERVLLSPDTIRKNIAGMEPQLRRFLNFDAVPNAAVLVNNYEWLGRFGYLEFLRDIGKHVPVSVMLAKESVRTRLQRDETGLSYTEFSYMLLQAYDFVHLYERFGCELQVGGSDQWGNITAGIDLARRLCGVQLYGCTCPILVRSDGSKMGKTEAGAIWLSTARTSPYHFYQYWINLDDEEAARCLRYFSELERNELEALLAEHQADPSRRVAQRRLAEELTFLVHGSEGLSAAQRATAVFFGAEIDELSEAQLNDIFADVPSRQLPRAHLMEEGLSVVDALVETGLCKNKSEARRVISQGGAYVNNHRVAGIDALLQPTQLVGKATIVLRTGKKNYALLRFS